MQPNLRCNIKMSFFALLFLLNTSCGNIADLAQGFLYPVDSANETIVPDLPPTGYGQETLEVSHPDGKLKIHLWYRKSPNASNTPVVIHFHGNGENIGSLAKGGFFAKMETLGTHFVVFDYPGYGKSTGFPEQSTLMAAAQATFNWTSKKFPQSDLILWGWSLGSAVAIQTAVANKENVSALIADSAWTNIRSLAKEKFGSLANQIPEELYLKNEWDSLLAAPKISVPLLMRHGSKDTLIPFAQGKLVAAAANQNLLRFVTVNEKGHGDIFADSDYWPDLIKFIESAK